jgi:hypothetical protein
MVPKEENIHSPSMSSSITLNDDGGVVMWNRLLFEMDQYESGQPGARSSESAAAQPVVERSVMITDRELTALTLEPLRR